MQIEFWSIVGMGNRNSLQESTVLILPIQVAKSDNKIMIEFNYGLGTRTIPILNVQLLAKKCTYLSTKYCKFHTLNLILISKCFLWDKTRLLSVRKWSVPLIRRANRLLASGGISYLAHNWIQRSSAVQSLEHDNIRHDLKFGLSRATHTLNWSGESIMFCDIFPRQTITTFTVEWKIVRLGSFSRSLLRRRSKLIALFSILWQHS